MDDRYSDKSALKRREVSHNSCTRHCEVQLNIDQVSDRKFCYDRNFNDPVTHQTNPKKQISHKEIEINIQQERKLNTNKPCKFQGTLNAISTREEFIQTDVNRKNNGTNTTKEILQVNKCEEENKKLYRLLEKLQSDIKNEKVRSAKLCDELDKIKFKSAEKEYKLSQQNNALNKEIEKYNQKLTIKDENEQRNEDKFLQEIEKLKIKYKKKEHDLQDELASYKNSLDKCKKQLILEQDDTLKRENMLRDRLEQLERKKNNLESKTKEAIRKSSCEVSKKDELIIQLQDKVDNYAKNEEELKNHITKITEEYKKREQQLSDKRKSLEMILEDSNQSQTRLQRELRNSQENLRHSQSLQKQLDESENQIKSTQMHLNNSTNKIKELESRINELLETNKRLVNKNEILQQEFESIKIDVKTRNEQDEKLKSLERTAKEKENDLLQEINKLKKLCDERNEIINKNSKQTSSVLESQLKDSKKIINELNHEKMKIEIEKQKVEENINQLINKYESLQEVSVTSESIRIENLELKERIQELENKLNEVTLKLKVSEARSHDDLKSEQSTGSKEENIQNDDSETFSNAFGYLSNEEIWCEVHEETTKVTTTFENIAVSDIPRMKVKFDKSNKNIAEISFTPEHNINNVDYK